MPKFRFQGPRAPRMPKGPRMPTTPMQRFWKHADPMYPFTWEWWDEQQKSGRQEAAAERILQIQEEMRLREAGYSDKFLSCANCGKLFLFSIRDQAFFARKGFSQPKYCSAACRASARDEREYMRSEKIRQREEQRRIDANQTIYITCIDCGKSFPFSKGEQEFYKSKGFKNPVRCSECRAKRKNR